MIRSMINRVPVAAALVMGGGLIQADEAVWFVVAEQEVVHGDSYLLPLTDPEDIADARALIAEGREAGVGSIVNVVIAPGGDGFNRDVLAAGQPAWSWRVTGFLGFSDVAIELCDGWPTWVEQDPAAWVANTDSVACFWSYTIVDELEAPPAFAVSGGLSGAWYNPETSGQGLFVDVIPDRREIFLGWFTYAAGGPVGRGEDEHAWMTAQGAFEGHSATLDVHLTTGGAFDDPQAVTTGRIGEVDLEFLDCDRGHFRYRFEEGQTREFPIRRIAAQPGCVSRSGDSLARDRNQGD